MTAFDGGGSHLIIMADLTSTIPAYVWCGSLNVDKYLLKSMYHNKGGEEFVEQHTEQSYHSLV